MLMTSMRAQAERFGAEVVTQKATKVDLSVSPVAIWLGGDEDGEPTVPGKGAHHRHRGPVAHARRAERGPAARLWRLDLCHL